MKEYIVDQSYDKRFSTAEEAVTKVEAAGKGTVVLFLGLPNMPNCKPDIVWRSNAMWKFEDGKWFQYSIFTGVSERLNEEKPR